jgi:pyruvate carboxylase
VHTAVAPLANGTSLPSTESVIKNLRRLGFRTSIDEDALAAVSAHFRKVAEEEGLPVGVPLEYDLFHFEHQVPGGMMTNLTRQLAEVGMENRLGEILEEVVLVRKELGYPVMATPYSQIVGAQAVENVVSGERYKQVTDEATKYVLGLYGEAAGPIDSGVVERVMSSPKAKQFTNWQPVGYDKPLEELRREAGPDLSDDDLLLKILIPGKRAKADGSKTGHAQPAPRRLAQGGPPSELPTEFSVDVDGEVFNVRVTPRWETPQSAGVEAAPAKNAPKELPPGAVMSGMAGLILSVKVQKGDAVKAGDLIAMIEAMKMRREIHAPHGGTVKEICMHEGDMVGPDDMLMVVG